jgi:glycosyltransferase involved in cell wall biosynthesis
VDSNNNSRTILVCGPIASEDNPSRGGFQSSNLRLLQTLRRLGYSSHGIPYPYTWGETVFEKALTYVKGFLKIIVNIIPHMRRGPTILHITPLVKEFIIPELVICYIAKIFMAKLVVDIRAGSQINHYNSKSFLYRVLYGMMLRRADAIAYEGHIYDDFIASIAPRISRHYLPNFLPMEFLKDTQIETRIGGPHLVYVGRVSQAKGALQSIRAFRELRMNFVESTLTLIGTADADCMPELSPEPEVGIFYTGPLSSDEIKVRLDKSHFFIFLTSWKGEGHSNALTEAMARGCVPVCTDHGFNRSIVGDCGHIVQDRDDISHISSLIGNTWNSHEWLQLSQRARNRVRLNFCEDCVGTSLNKLYGSLL